MVRRLPSRLALLVGVALILAIGEGCAEGGETTEHGDTEIAALAERSEADDQPLEKPSVSVAGPDQVPSLLAKAPALAPAEGIEELNDSVDRAIGRVPIGLSIERLGLFDIGVVPVGVELSGEMAIPPPAEVGWYRFGPVPGDPGSTVLAGHIASEGVDGAFRHLDRLDVGDSIAVTNADGSHLEYIVVDKQQIAKANLVSTEAFVPSGPTRLTLITCGGSFDHLTRSYEDNIVVTAELAETET